MNITTKDFLSINKENNLLLQLPKPLLLNIISMFDVNGLHAFKCCSKGNYNFYKEKEKEINLKYFKKFFQDPRAWLYLSSKIQGNRELKESFINFVNKSEYTAPKGGGTPYLFQLRQYYPEFCAIKKNLSENENESLSVNQTGDFRLIGMKYGKMIIVENSLDFQVKICDLVLKRIIILENSRPNVPHNPNKFYKFDESKKRIYLSLKATSSNNSSIPVVVSWDLLTGKIISKFEDEAKSPIALVIDDQELYVGMKGKITVFNTETGECLRSTKNLKGEVYQLKKNGNTLISLEKTLSLVNHRHLVLSTIKVLNSTTLEVVQEIPNIGVTAEQPINGNYFVLRENNGCYLIKMSNSYTLEKIGQLQDDSFLYKLKFFGNYFFLLPINLNQKPGDVARCLKIEDKKEENPINLVCKCNNTQVYLQEGYLFEGDKIKDYNKKIKDTTFITIDGNKPSDY